MHTAPALHLLHSTIMKKSMFLHRIAYVSNVIEVLAEIVLSFHNMMQGIIIDHPDMNIINL